MACWDKADLHRAIDRDEFGFCLQPIVQLQTERIHGFEVLARWTHPEHGSIYPADFIPAIEQAGLLDLLTGIILRKTFAAARHLIPKSLSIAINVSPQQLIGDSLVELISRSAEEEQFALNRLTIELTESSPVDKLDRALSCANSLKAMGVRLALDDFGTAYSSLHHLQALPFDEVKIDQSFVRSMLHKRECRKIVAAIIRLCDSLGMVSIAEGVESSTEGNLLTTMGCDLGQGWLYGRPMRAEDVPAKFPLPLLKPSLSGNRIDESLQSGSNVQVLPALRLAQLQAIYDGAPVGLCFVDPQLRFVSINERLARINNRSIVEHLGRTVHEMVPHTFDQIRLPLQRALRGQPIHNLEVQIRDTAHEQRKTVLANYQPAFDEEGEVIGVMVAVTDITSHVEAERARRIRELQFASSFHAAVRDLGGKVLSTSRISSTPDL